MPEFDKTENNYMKKVLKLAEKGRGLTSPNPMVGSVVVSNGKITGSGFHEKTGGDHAETKALRDAGNLSRGATLYVNLEPCAHQGNTPPCVEGIIKAGIARVVTSMVDPDPRVCGKGIEWLRREGVQVDVGCMEQDARRLNEFFVVFHEKKRPFITLKWAMTVCGRTSHDSGYARWVSNRKSREYVHRQRSYHEAILIGIGTVLADDPMLNVRLPNFKGRQPIKVIIDGSLALPTRARLLRHKGRNDVIVCCSELAKTELVRHFESEGLKVIRLPGERRVVDLNLVLNKLAELGVQSVLVEGGRQIHTSLLNLGLVDKITAFVSPKIIGGELVRSPIEDLHLPNLDRAFVLYETRWKTFGDDICMESYFHETGSVPEK
jgi:diaminohydroxyphosphoribosylaminopyrimidine deaminase/5-amino-6-(5-phosphoribosylamino)uracil reductase